MGEQGDNIIPFPARHIEQAPEPPSPFFSDEQQFALQAITSQLDPVTTESMLFTARYLMERRGHPFEDVVRVLTKDANRRRAILNARHADQQSHNPTEEEESDED